MAASAAVPVVATTAESAVDWLLGRGRKRQRYVFQWAAEAAGMDPEELARRCEADPSLEELLLKVMDAAEDTATRERLVLYALALASGARSTETHRWEAALVDAVKDLRVEHFIFLERFAQALRKNPVTGAPRTAGLWFRFALDERTLQQIGPDLPSLPSIIAALERHGLVARRSAGGGTAFRGGPQPAMWDLTAFGQAVLGLLQDLEGKLSNPGTGP